MSRSLADLQRWFQAVITHPAGVEPGLESDGAREYLSVPTENLAAVILPSSQLGSLARLEVYANAYYARLLECLRDSFPTLVYAVGREAFDDFAFAYLQEFPPASYTLNQLAARFVDFLAAIRPESVATEPGFPEFVVDLARLEWAIEQVFDGPGWEGTDVLSSAELRAIAPENWPEIVLRPAACLRLLAFDFPVNDFFSAVRAGRQPEPPRPGKSYVALSRINYVVRRFPLDADAFGLLSSLVAGNPVGKAVALAAAALPADDRTLAARIEGWFRAWSEAGFFAALSAPK